MHKGFTLVELLIVIAILAVLATVVVLVINPAQLLAESRDGQRLSDMNTVRDAVAFYLASASSPTLTAGPFSTNNATCGLSAGTCTVRNLYGVDGTGWVGVDLTSLNSGSPLPTLPRDPTNNATYQYAYEGDNTAKTFELNARLESTRHRDKMTTDGGDDSTCSTYTESTCYYEIGSDTGLNL